MISASYERSRIRVMRTGTLSVPDLRFSERSRVQRNACLLSNHEERGLC